MGKDRVAFNTEVAECTEKKRRARGKGLDCANHNVYYRESIQFVKEKVRSD